MRPDDVLKLTREDISQLTRLENLSFQALESPLEVDPVTGSAHVRAIPPGPNSPAYLHGDALWGRQHGRGRREVGEEEQRLLEEQAEDWDPTAFPARVVR